MRGGINSEGAQHLSVGMSTWYVSAFVSRSFRAPVSAARPQQFQPWQDLTVCSCLLCVATNELIILSSIVGIPPTSSRYGIQDSVDNPWGDNVVLHLLQSKVGPYIEHG